MRQIAHDIRGQLAEIQACAEMLQRRHGESDFLRNVYRSVSRIDSILGAIAPRAADAPHLRVDRDVNQLIREIAQMSIYTAVVTFRLDLDETVPAMPPHTSPSDLDRILQNLCSNAKHAMLNAARAGAQIYDSSGSTSLPATFDPLPHELGTIRIATRHLGPAIQISVADTGPGLSSAALHRLRVRMKGGEESIVGGHGHGLQIVQAITARLCATIEIDSAEGTGTIFTLAIPLLPSAAALEAAAA